MAQMRDIPTSILAKEGTEVKTGVLSILEKKGSKILKSSEYQLYHLHWRLVSYGDQTYLLGYSRTFGGARATKKLLVKGCSTKMNLPENVVVSLESSKTFLCIQCGEKITFLKAESKHQRNEWVDAIRITIKDPIYYPVSTPDGQMTNRASPSSKEMASAITLQSQQSPIHSLNSADRRQSSSQRKLDDTEIYEKYENNETEGFEHCDVLSLSEDNEPGYEHIKDDDFHPSPSDVCDEEFYYNISVEDDQSSVSRVNNLGLESEGNANSPLNDNDEETAAPELPKRNNQNPTSVVQEGLVRTKSSKKTRASQSPEAPIYQLDSIQREKKMNSEDPNVESLHAYVQKFRSELFQEDGFIVEVDKTDLSPESMMLVCVADFICIAALPNDKFHSLLHVDDVIVKVNRQTLPSIDFCYTLFRTTDENKVQLHVKRVMHGVICHVNMSANEDVDSLGLEFGNQSQGNEVTAMHSEGLVAKSGSPSRPRAMGVVNGGMLINWGLVEINQSPVSFDSSPADVWDQIQRAGCELALVFIPMDIINVFKEGRCDESTDQASKEGGTC